MKHPAKYQGEHVVILGMARSGCAAAKLFHELGAIVTVNDRKPLAECPEAEELSALGIRVICGYHPADLLDDHVQLVVKNPGIPYVAEPLQQAAARGIEIVTEVEVAYMMTDVPIIGITGSNGKTTTTSWVYEILSAAGLKPLVAGNIGRPMCEVVTDAVDPAWLVSELSSFQLKGTIAFRPKISCLLNFTETHLDYHGSLDDYWNSKLKLFANQTQDDKAVLSRDDPAVYALAGKLDAEVMLFSLQHELEYGMFVHNERIVFRDLAGDRHELLAVRDIGIPASFNVENALAAAAISRQAGAPLEVISEQLRAFRGVPHRLEFVRELRGIKYYNNSKATNALATRKALDAFDRPVVLIAGGLDRGADFHDLMTVFRERVKALVLIGETKEKLQAVGEQAGVARICVMADKSDAAQLMREAVEQASHLASPGDVIMLSPACASWDMFTSFEERGRMFKESVHNLN